MKRKNYQYQVRLNGRNLALRVNVDRPSEASELARELREQHPRASVYWTRVWI